MEPAQAVGGRGFRADTVPVDFSREEFRDVTAVRLLTAQSAGFENPVQPVVGIFRIQGDGEDGHRDLIAGFVSGYVACEDGGYALADDTIFNMATQFVRVVLRKQTVDVLFTGEESEEWVVIPPRRSDGVITFREGDEKARLPDAAVDTTPDRSIRPS